VVSCLWSTALHNWHYSHITFRKITKNQTAGHFSAFIDALDTLVPFVAGSNNVTNKDFIDP
jgi:hypothetical protein